MVTGTKTTFLYALNDPRTGLMRYIGKADNPSLRLTKHISRRNSPDHRGAWIRSLLAQGLRPELQILLEIPYEWHEEMEIRMIRAFRDSGADLTNSTAGGDGGRDPSAETRAKLANNNHFLGHKHSLESRAMISASLIGNNRTLGYKHSCESLAKLRDANLGKKHSLAARKNISRAAFIREQKKREREQKEKANGN